MTESCVAGLAAEDLGTVSHPGRPVAAPVVCFRLSPDPAQVTCARSLTRQALADWGLTGRAWLAELIVSELVTNAIVHGTGAVGVRLSCSGGWLRFEVHDGQPGHPVRRCPSADDEAGRGLALVDGLIREHGGERDTLGDSDGPGKTVRVSVRISAIVGDPRVAGWAAPVVPIEPGAPGDPRRAGDRDTLGGGAVTGSAASLAPPASRPQSHAHLQALDDAIRYRTARLAAPCGACRPGDPCDDHACDLTLLDAYHEMAHSAVAALRSARLRQARGTPETGVGRPDTR